VISQGRRRLVVEREVDIDSVGAGANVGRDDRGLTARPDKQQIDVVGEGMAEAGYDEVDVGDRPAEPRDDTVRWIRGRRTIIGDRD
jgi:hypothetical protein